MAAIDPFSVDCRGDAFVRGFVYGLSDNVDGISSPGVEAVLDQYLKTPAFRSLIPMIGAHSPAS